MRVVSFLFMYCLVVATISNAQNVEELWETDPIFDVPEAVLLNDTLMYVSNIGGDGLAKDGNGFISLLSTKGNLVKKDWGKGLNAPKGMCMNDQFLFVTDIDEVVMLDINTGDRLSIIKVEGSKFLNDIVVTENGQLYITDFHDQAVYRYDGKKVELFLKDDILDHANGLLYKEGVLYVGSNTQISTIDLKTREIKKWADVSDNVDGLEKISDSQMLVSSWSGKVQLVSQNEKPIVLFNFEDQKHNTADMDYDPKTNIMYIPTFFRNTVFAAKLLIDKN